MFSEKIKIDIKSSEYSSIVVSGEQIFKSNKRGVAPILDLIDRDDDVLNGAIAYDNVIGKAAAMLLIKYKVSQIYALIISQHACDLLDKYGVHYECEQKVSYIINRAGDGMCPLETEVLEMTDIEGVEERIRARIKILMSK
ncbi:MAG: DUF1893 domain-containing protein [Clostridia bacterium]